MSATILDGKALAASIKQDLSARVKELKVSGVTPGLGTILVGDDPGSLSYVAGKHRDCQEVGITSIRVDLKADASESDVLAAIKDLNSAKECSGYIVQLPLPHGVNTQKVLEASDPAIDADGSVTYTVTASEGSPLIFVGVTVNKVTIYANPGLADPAAAIVFVPAEVNESVTTAPLPNVPPAILISTRLAFAGKVGSSTLINPAPPVIVVTGAVGTASVVAPIEYPGDHSLIVPSAKTY